MADKEGKILTLEFAGGTISGETLGLDNEDKVNVSAVKEDVQISSAQLKREKDKALIKNAMIQGRREFDEVQESYENFMGVLSDTAMFTHLVEPLRQILGSYFEMCDDILKDKRTLGIPEEDFKRAQIDIIKRLVAKYKDK